VPALWPWLVPVGVATFIYATRGRPLERVVAGLLAFVVVLIASRRPDRGLLVLIVGLPFQGFVLAQLYAWGLPAGLVRPLSSWKEALALGVVLAAVRGFRTRGRRLDRLDALGLGYIAIVGTYALLPHLFAPDAPVTANALSLAFRSSAGFVILLLAARHAPLPDDFVARAARVVLLVGGVVAAIAVYEYFFSATWNRFVIHDVQYLRYQVDILHSKPPSATDVLSYGDVGGRRIVRVGSVFLDPLSCGFYLVLPFAVAVERRLRERLRSGAGLLLILIAAALLLTQTRAALIGAIAVVFLALRSSAGRTSRRRTQFAVIFAAGVIVALPAVTAIGLSERVSRTASGREPSSIDHVQSFWTGVDAIEAAPLGHGLGTSAGVGQRFAAAQATITENYYLQVGVETGVIAMALFLALTLVMIRYVGRATRSTGDLGATATRSAAIGLAIGALLLHAWLEFSVSWVLWSLAGASIGLAERAPGPRPAAVSSTTASSSRPAPNPS
jgi:hypothetical protein